MALTPTLVAFTRPTVRALVAAALLGTPLGAVAQPISSAFTYQGELASAGVPASGTFDIRFRLYDAPGGGNQIGSTLCADDLAITAGRFAASLDFGAAAFAGQQRFLEIEVRQDSGLDCSDATGYTVLSPRQELTATPNATFAQNAAAAGIALTATNATQLNGQPASFFTNAANLAGTLPSAALSGSYSGVLYLSNPSNLFVGSGTGITGLNAANITSGLLSNARTTGTSASTPNTLILRDASGGFAAGTITAALNGNASSATNAAQLNGQPAAFYQNAANLASGTLADTRLSANIPRLNASNTFSSTLNTFAGNLLIGGIENVAIGIDAQPNPRLGIVKKFGLFPMIASAANQPIVFGQSNLGDLLNVSGATFTERLRIAANGNIQVPGGVITNGSAPVGTLDMGLYSQAPGLWMRFVTNGGNFLWFTESGPDSAGQSPRMTLAASGLTVDGTLSVTDAPSQLAQEPWQIPTLGSGFVNVGGGTTTAGYFKDSLGMVHLRGRISGPNTLPPVLVLPPGYRPAARYAFATPTADPAFVGVDRIAIVEVWSSGEVRLTRPVSSWFTLDGITFRAEQ